MGKRNQDAKRTIGKLSILKYNDKFKSSTLQKKLELVSERVSQVVSEIVTKVCRDREATCGNCLSSSLRASIALRKTCSTKSFSSSELKSNLDVWKRIFYYKFEMLVNMREKKERERERRSDSNRVRERERERDRDRERKTDSNRVRERGEIERFRQVGRQTKRQTALYRNTMLKSLKFCLTASLRYFYRAHCTPISY